jgi:pimeloyl-ACP methyl ester carboxylesterase
MKANFDYPTKRVRIGDMDASYWESGTGHPIILIHGMGGSKEHFAWMIPLLEQHYRVFAVDLPGFGESDVPTAELTMEFVVKFINDFRQALGIEKWTIVAHSLGTHIAIQYALLHKETLLGLVLICVLGMGRDVDFISRLVGTPFLNRMIFHITRDAIADVMSTVNPVAELDRAIDLVYQQYQRPGMSERHLKIQEQGVKLWGQTLLYDREDLKTLDFPILAYWAEQDQIIPVKHAKEAQNIFPQILVNIFPDSKHMAHIEKADVIAKQIRDYLTEHFSLGG